MFGEIVRRHRRTMGLSQAELAERSGISVRSIGSIETGRVAAVRPATARLLADAFGLRGADRDRFCQASTSSPVQEAGTDAAGRHEDAVAPLPPHQLPPAPRHFAGRAAELRAMTAALEDATDGAAVLVTAVDGTAGIGKTALALHWAHQVHDRFPDGELYVNLRGFDPGGTAVMATEALRRFLGAVGVAAAQIPADLDAQAAAYRSRLAGRRMLILLDNARDADQVRPLLPGTPGCLVLVTSRNQMPGLVAVNGAYPLTLDLLGANEASQLLTRRLGAQRTGAEPDAVEEIVAYCAGLPLALALAAAHAATRPQHPLRRSAEQLRDRRHRLNELSASEPTTDLHAVFSWSYDALSAAGARLFRLLGLHPVPDVSAAAAASLTGLRQRQVRQLLAELVRVSLITEHSPGRYGCHDLLHAYASELTQAYDAEPDRRGARHRMLDHYLHTGHAAALLIYPERDPITVQPAQPGVIVEHLADATAATAWLTTEHRVLMAAIADALANGFPMHTWQLAWSLTTIHDRHGHWHDWVVAQEAAVAAAGRLADSAAQGIAHRLLGRAYTRVGRHEDAQEQLRYALDAFEAVGERTRQAHTHLDLADTLLDTEQHREALAHVRRALALYRATGHQVGQADALAGIGLVLAMLGDHATALGYCEQALALHQALGHSFGQATTWDNLGLVHQQLGHHTEAAKCYRQAAALLREAGDRYFGAQVTTRLGDAQQAGGNTEAARQSWQQALEILTDLQHQDAATVLGKLRELDTQAV
jgi:tetratricopeptide (TPR) repeat protein/transcriptional regulator with XRE-family HTH domain